MNLVGENVIRMLSEAQDKKAKLEVKLHHKLDEKFLSLSQSFRKTPFFMIFKTSTLPPHSRVTQGCKRVISLQRTRVR